MRCRPCWRSSSASPRQLGSFASRSERLLKPTFPLPRSLRGPALPGSSFVASAQRFQLLEQAIRRHCEKLVGATRGSIPECRHDRRQFVGTEVVFSIAAFFAEEPTGASDELRLPTVPGIIEIYHIRRDDIDVSAHDPFKFNLRRKGPRTSSVVLTCATASSNDISQSPFTSSSSCESVLWYQSHFAYRKTSVSSPRRWHRSRIPLATLLSMSASRTGCSTQVFRPCRS